MAFSATYSPQDDKIRLFFGGTRIPKDEWDRLKGAGFTWTMKQDSDMVGLWTPAREDIALDMCGDIEDEDQPREERAADRAERFEGYRDKREGEAVGLADRFDSGPAVHGNQSLARATRAAARHDRIGGHAVNQWSKAEYWQRRTAGVIAHALYLEQPAVRHRRIKGLEADLRAASPGRWADHYQLRLAYEKQMLAAQGGTAADEADLIAPGGFIGRHQVQKVTKDKAGRISKLYFKNDEGRLSSINGERLKPGSYRAPTAEEAAAFKDNKPKAPPLLNPTMESARALVDAWNAASVAQRAADKAANRYYCEANYETAHKVESMTAAEFTARKARSDSYFTRELSATGETLSRWSQGPKVDAVCKVRMQGGYRNSDLIHLSDKPAVALPIVAPVTVTA